MDKGDLEAMKLQESNRERKRQLKLIRYYFEKFKKETESGGW